MVHTIYLYKMSDLICAKPRSAFVAKVVEKWSVESIDLHCGLCSIPDPARIICVINTNICLS